MEQYSYHEDLEKSHWKRKQYKIVKTQEKAFIS